MASIFKRGGRKNRHGKYIASWFDENGKRLNRSTGTTDCDAAHQIASKWETDAALRRQGVINPSQARVADHSLRPVGEHIREYLEHCEHIGQDSTHRVTKKTQLKNLIEGICAARLADLEPNRVEPYLAGLVKTGKSHRTHNQNRATIVAFMQWCFEQGRVSSNGLKIVPTLNEARDRRRVRRALTEDEMARLVNVSESRGHYYLFAYYTGLRVKAVQAAVWGDVDFEKALIRVKVGNAKGKKDDIHQPLHPRIIEGLAKLKSQASSALPADLIFPRVPTIRTFHKDCLRAGIARYDDEGRQIDRHALRTTLGTNLARAGVLPQLAMKVMGHADVQTTMKHYTDLRLADTTKAVNTLPSIGCRFTAVNPKAILMKTTVTDDSSAQQKRQQLCGLNQQDGAATGTDSNGGDIPLTQLLATVNAMIIKGLDADCQSSALADLNMAAAADNMPGVRAVSSVG